jgi:hypothetical protein
LGGQFNPGQSIFTAIGPRYTNTFGTQLNYVLSKRSSITFGGLFSIERFVDAGNIESDDYTGNIGYNYQITRADTIGILYRYSSIHYLGLPQAIGDYSIQAAYGRKITGRLALQLTGGPEITHQRVPQGTNTQQQFVAGTGSATISYAFEKGSISANYFHGVTTGSGVFLGATTDQVTDRCREAVSSVGKRQPGLCAKPQPAHRAKRIRPNYDTFMEAHRWRATRPQRHFSWATAIWRGRRRRLRRGKLRIGLHDE